jgi:hypothetical protein
MIELSSEDHKKIDIEFEKLDKKYSTLIEKHLNVDLGSQILRSINESNYIQASRFASEDTNKSYGRPEVRKTLTEDEANELLKKHFSGKELLKKDQRSDAKNTTSIRHIKKFPDAILKKIGSKCQYKSKELDTALRQYILCFMEGYQKFYNHDPSENMIERFFDFVVLSFPESKVYAILKILERKSFLSHILDYKSLKEQVVIRNYSSKRMLGYLYSSNRCLQHISNILLKKNNCIELPIAVKKLLEDLKQQNGY